MKSLHENKAKEKCVHAEVRLYPVYNGTRISFAPNIRKLVQTKLKFISVRK